MHVIRERSDVERLFGLPLAILFKHSTACGISESARREAEQFLAAHPEHSIHLVDVLASRRVSDYIEARTGVRHESPQILVLRNGEVVWHGSHSRVTAEAIAASVG